MTFAGWPEDALDFYEGLEADNSKSYWTAHKPSYDGAVLGPMQALLADVAAEFGEPKVFRPYRDVRFAKDKSPYKPWIGALAGHHYVQLSAAGLMVAAGSYEMSSEQVGRLREAVAADRSGRHLAGIVDDLEATGIAIGGESLKTVPRGYDKDHPRARLLRHRSLYGKREFPLEPWLHTAAAKDRVVETWRAMGALVAWLSSHVG
jgi:uncharacterized protein (TIGR02453 family)